MYDVYVRVEMRRKGCTRLRNIDVKPVLQLPTGSKEVPRVVGIALTRRWAPTVRAHGKPYLSSQVLAANAKLASLQPRSSLSTDRGDEPSPHHMINMLEFLAQAQRCVVVDLRLVRRAYRGIVALLINLPSSPVLLIQNR